MLVHIPDSLVDSGTAGAPLQNGHGLLGGKTEGENGYLATRPLYPDSDDPHDSVRKLDAAYDQSDEFFRTGIVKPFCVGPCDPQ